MMNKVLRVLSNRPIFQNSRLFGCGYYHVRYLYRINSDTPTNVCHIQDGSNLFMVKRFKHKKKDSVKKIEEDDLESDDEEEEEFDYDESKSKSVITDIKVQSLRVDVVIKAALGIARKKIEDAFYNSRIRVNGKKVLKVSSEINVNDEIDLIRSRSNENPNLLIVSRITILTIEPKGGALKLKICKDKSLLIEDYSEPWKDKMD